MPHVQALPLYDLHRALGVALILLLLLWKQRIVRRSLGRHLRPSGTAVASRASARSLIPGLLAGMVLLASLAIGLAWTLQILPLDALGGYSPLNLHVFLGLAVLPFMLAHLRRRWEGPPRLAQLATRRQTLRLLGLSAATLVGWRLVELAAGAFAPPGFRRPSGSKHAASFSGNAFPVTSWLFDTTPPLDPATWRLELVGKLAAPGPLSLPELTALPTRQARAILDCTGGWWSEQHWRGISLPELLAARGLDPAAREVTVISVTGHRWPFPLADLQDALLATHVGDEPLSPDHGAPVRLVAPQRRGFQWVKWVARVEVA